ncbi:hypothetical protein ACIHAX_25085 [Nocardia sp. NPDC051929]|uniref:hypothetical protein n=1 Tax=Nocardia sp. NPDC051929 TaxID=3364327 RepID=UPI0037CB3888
MIDGMAVATHLAAALGATGGRPVDRSVDQGLTALTGVVTRGLGRRALDDLDQNPHSMAARRQLAAEIERAAAADTEFARELAALQATLGRLNGGTVINTATHGSRIVTGSKGITAGGSIHNTTYDIASDEDLSRAPVWTKALLWIGLVFVGIGFVGGLIGMSRGASVSGQFNLLPFFLIGGVLMTFAELGARTSTPRRRR